MKLHMPRYFAMLIATVIATVAVLVTTAAQAEVKPHGLFTDNMVLQRDMPAPVWGWAADGEKVTVSFAGQEKSATAKDGRWMVKLDPLSANAEGAELTIAGPDNTVTLQNVLVGEVWICSGQSNMQWPINRSADPEQTAAEAKDSKLRLYTVPRRATDEPQQDVESEWLVCSPETVPDFSAVAYHFGSSLRENLDVPVGLISTNYGGTPAEAWTSRERLEAHDDLKYMAAAESDPNNVRRPIGLYNAMINPLIPYAIRGAIWYQGESNAGRAVEYATLFPEMISDWRDRWDSEFPFLFVQLAPFLKKVNEPGDSAWAELREAQRLTLTALPQTGMAVITDYGDEDDIHPQQKKPVGQRLALAARKLAYGQDLVYSGPDLKDVKFTDGHATVTFQHVGSGLEARGDQLTGFAIAGADGKFHNAEAKIEGDQVIVSSPAVKDPQGVRYGWANFPQGNLYNKEGLPATPFRTDDFPLSTAKAK